MLGLYSGYDVLGLYRDNEMETTILEKGRGSHFLWALLTNQLTLNERYLGGI